MADPNPHARTPHDCLGVDPDATETEVEVAAANARAAFNPDHYPEGAKRLAREKLYRVRAARDAIVDDGTYPPPDSDLGAASETTTVDGHPRVVRLGVDPMTTSVTTGESLTVAVRRQCDGQLVDGAVVETDRGHETVARRGRTTLSFDSPGTVSVVARRDGGRPTYESGSTTVSVTPARPTLGLDVPSVVTVGDRITAELRDQSGDPVAGARVTVRQTQSTAGGDRGRDDTRESASRDSDGATVVSTATTDARGRTRLVVDTPGEYTVRAVSHSEARTDRNHRARHGDDDGPRTNRQSSPSPPALTERTVRVEPEPVPLAVCVLRDPAGPGSEGEFVVRDASGERVSGVTLTAAGQTTETDDRGCATLRFPRAGTVRVRAEADGPFESATTRVVVPRESSSL
ncbi:MAG: hypothetical protein ABEH80_04140 [Halobaculum sp.]